MDKERRFRYYELELGENRFRGVIQCRYFYLLDGVFHSRLKIKDLVGLPQVDCRRVILQRNTPGWRYLGSMVDTSTELLEVQRYKYSDATEEFFLESNGRKVEYHECVGMWSTIMIQAPEYLQFVKNTTDGVISGVELLCGKMLPGLDMKRLFRDIRFTEKFLPLFQRHIVDMKDLLAEYGDGRSA